MGANYSSLFAQVFALFSLRKERGGGERPNTCWSFSVLARFHFGRVLFLALSSLNLAFGPTLGPDANLADFGPVLVFGLMGHPSPGPPPQPGPPSAGPLPSAGPTWPKLIVRCALSLFACLLCVCVGVGAGFMSCVGGVGFRRTPPPAFGPTAL